MFISTWSEQLTNCILSDSKNACSKEALSIISRNSYHVKTNSIVGPQCSFNGTNSHYIRLVWYYLN